MIFGQNKSITHCSIMERNQESSLPTDFCPLKPLLNASIVSPSPHSADFTELQHLLAQAKEENQALEQIVQLEKMWQELETLHLQNAKLERKCVPPNNSSGTKHKQHLTTLCDLRSSEVLTAQVEPTIAQRGKLVVMRVMRTLTLFIRQMVSNMVRSRVRWAN